MSLYSNKWLHAHDLLISGELPSPFPFLLCPHSSSLAHP
jgi:hypothetical protein